MSSVPPPPETQIRPDGFPEVIMGIPVPAAVFDPKRHLAYYDRHGELVGVSEVTDPEAWKEVKGDGLGTHFYIEIKKTSD